ncbi:general secretion pathway protein GspK [Gilvimarinus agarilyticus]|uniref:type II secretion system protein GspK n=1 Tax=Gilvimarinus sp. 2_MG-2023 TaxID=3062666 RepID=UPI001C0A52FB|nr:type II secretion system protein GspK [Gilvimarinus sp. 2_MG-2023]MBU2887577.1 general secretion pathway protein GspK [Gilvimarinus agarilyticus]MDO6572228.1 type II secretion system protein GspK [Gilvimarinus sp. 2_MG-2023]
MRFRQIRVVSGRQRGMALALLLWFLAALTLMVGGLMLLARTDITYANLHRHSAQAAALGDGAALSLLAGVNAQHVGHLSYQVSMPGHSVALQAVPAVGLVNIYQADEVLLTRLFSDLGGIPSAQAIELANSVVKWRDLRAEEIKRSTRDAKQANSIEDLLSVRGVTREVFERIKPWIHAESTSGRVNMEWAPAQVMALLDAEQESPPIDEYTGDESVSDTLYNGTLRISAKVSFDGRKIFKRTVWVRRSSRTLLGWAILRREPVTVTTAENK